MSGYTPLFDSLTRGTLCGKWPDIGLWPVLLSMADWRGEIDATQQYIATVTGLPLADVTACIKRFCQPDEGSRSHAAQGARLELVDEHRDWGWRVVNIQKYRDKASGMAQVADGRNAKKVRKYKERHRRTPADTGGHPQTPTHTHTHTHTKTNTKDIRAAARAFDPSEVPGLNLEAWKQWIEYREERKPPIKAASMQAAAEELAEFAEDQLTVVKKSIAAGYQGLFAPKQSSGWREKPYRKAPTTEELEAEERANASG